MGPMLYSSLSILLVAWVCSARGATPIVTWHGAGGTTAECDKMIDTIRSVAMIFVEDLNLNAIFPY